MLANIFVRKRRKFCENDNLTVKVTLFRYDEIVSEMILNWEISVM